MSGWQIVRLDELERVRVGEHGLHWLPVRRTLGIEAFGVNAYTADEAGQEVVEHHDETGHGAGKPEELYVVIRGRARFQLDDEEVDAPAGTFVFVRERVVRRGAYAEEPGTTVLALGGVPGEAFRVSPWEYSSRAMRFFDEGDFAGARDFLARALEEHPDQPGILYNLACAEARLGERERALEHLGRSAELDGRFAEYAQDDEDLASVRDDPRFPAA